MEIAAQKRSIAGREKIKEKVAPKLLKEITLSRIRSLSQIAGQNGGWRAAVRRVDQGLKVQR